MSLQQLLASGHVIVNQTRVGRHVEHGAALSVAQVDDAARQRRVETERPAQRLSGDGDGGGEREGSGLRGWKAGRLEEKGNMNTRSKWTDGTNR